MWFLVHVVPGREQAAARLRTCPGVLNVVPSSKGEGYALLEADDDSIVLAVSKLKDVLGFAGGKRSPQPVPQETVDALRQGASGGEGRKSSVSVRVRLRRRRKGQGPDRE